MLRDIEALIADAPSIESNFRLIEVPVKVGFGSSIQAVISEAASTERDFALSSYRDSTDRTPPSYAMNRDGFTLLSMGFTGKKALVWKVRCIEALDRKVVTRHRPLMRFHRGPAGLIVIGIIFGTVLGASLFAVLGKGPTEAFAVDGMTDWLGSWGAILGGLLAGAITVMAAYIAARPVFDQLAEMRRQSAAAARTAMDHRPTELQEELDILEQIRTLLRKTDIMIGIYQHSLVRFHEHAMQLIDEVSDNFGELIEKTSLVSDRYGDAHVTNKTRAAQLRALFEGLDWRRVHEPQRTPPPVAAS